MVFADLGAGVLDSAMVETAAYCLESPYVTLFLRLLQSSVEAKALHLRRMIPFARTTRAAKLPDGIVFA